MATKKQFLTTRTATIREDGFPLTLQCSQSRMGRKEVEGHGLGHSGVLTAALDGLLARVLCRHICAARYLRVVFGLYKYSCHPPIA